MCGPSACPPLHCFLLCSPPCLLKVSQEILACSLRFLKQAWGEGKDSQDVREEIQGLRSPQPRPNVQQPLHSVTHTATHQGRYRSACPALCTLLYMFLYIIHIMFQFLVNLELRQHFSTPQDNGTSQEEQLHHHHQGFTESP